jgi:hypothetical protein
MLTVADRSADVLPEPVRPKGEPREESDSEPRGRPAEKDRDVAAADGPWADGLAHSRRW